MSNPTGTSSQSSGEPLQNPSEFLSAALDGEISDAELEAVNQSINPIILNETLSKHGQGKELISVEDAQAKLPPEVLQVLATQFKGSLTQVRHRDERDQLF